MNRSPGCLTGLKDSLTPFPRDLKNQDATYSLSPNSTSAYLFPFRNFEAKKEREGKQDLNKGRWLLLLRHFLWGELEPSQHSNGCAGRNSGETTKHRKGSINASPSPDIVQVYLTSLQTPEAPHHFHVLSLGHSLLLPFPLRGNARLTWPLSCRHPALPNGCEIVISGGLRLLDLCKWQGSWGWGRKEEWRKQYSFRREEESLKTN